jgi:hypothetical protein
LSEDLLSGEQVPCDECSADGRGSSEELSRGNGKLLREKNLSGAIRAKDEIIPLKYPVQPSKFPAQT